MYLALARPAFRLGLAAALGLLLVSVSSAGNPACSSCANPKEPPYTACRGCLQKKYYAPYVHPCTTFGYYPTRWMTFPEYGQPMFDGMRPSDAEPLPAPRPETRRKQTNEPDVRVINPANYRSR